MRSLWSRFVSFRIYIGTAGWQYKDWNGKFYPQKLKQPPLQFYAEYFDTVEINSSFYGHIKPKVATTWCTFSAVIPPIANAGMPAPSARLASGASAFAPLTAT